MPGVVIVIDRAGRRHQVVGRAAETILHIVIRQERVNAARSGSLVFHFTAGEIKPSFVEDWEKTPT